MYNFKENQKELQALLQEAFDEKRGLCMKTNELSTFIDPEFFDIQDKQESLVCSQIQKSLEKINLHIQDKLRKKVEDEEIKLEFQYFKNKKTPFEPISYLYGYIQDESIQRSIKFTRVPKSVTDPLSFFLILDTLNGPTLLPWE